MDPEEQRGEREPQLDPGAHQAVPKVQAADREEPGLHAHDVQPVQVRLKWPRRTTPALHAGCTFQKPSCCVMRTQAACMLCLRVDAAVLRAGCCRPCLGLGLCDDLRGSLTTPSGLTCRYEWCWLCQGSWAEHGERTGGFYNCNRWAGNCAASGSCMQELTSAPCSSASAGHVIGGSASLSAAAGLCSLPHSIGRDHRQRFSGLSISASDRRTGED